MGRVAGSRAFASADGWGHGACARRRPRGGRADEPGFAQGRQCGGSATRGVGGSEGPGVGGESSGGAENPREDRPRGRGNPAQRERTRRKDNASKRVKQTGVESALDGVFGPRTGRRKRSRFERQGEGDFRFVGRRRRGANRLGARGTGSPRRARETREDRSEPSGDEREARGNRRSRRVKEARACVGIGKRVNGTGVEESAGPSTGGPTRLWITAREPAASEGVRTFGEGKTLKEEQASVAVA